MITPRKKLNKTFIRLLLIYFLLTVNVFFGTAIYYKLKSPDFTFNMRTLRANDLIQEPPGTAPVTIQSELESPVQTTSQTMSAKSESQLLDIPVIGQYPELYNGCEVTSLAMLIQYYGLDVSKLELAEAVKKDDTPMQIDDSGVITHWGNPHTGFVGDIAGYRKGLGVYHEPLFALLQDYVPTAIDLSGEEFDVLESYLSDGVPVVVWTTVNFTVPREWLTWDSPTGKVTSTFLEHAVLLVGFNDKFVFVNDPASATKQMKLDKQEFIQVYKAMGKQAISYTLSGKDEQNDL